MKIQKLLISVLFTCALLVSSCTLFQKQDTHTPLTNPLLQKLPKDSIGFFSLDTRSSAFNLYKTGAWSHNKKSFLNWIKLLQFGQENETLDNLLGVLEQTGLVTTTATQPEAVASLLGFIELDKGSASPVFSLYFDATEGTNFKDKLHAMEVLLRDLKLEIKREDIGVAECFSITGLLKQSPLMQKIFVAANKDRMAITNVLSSAVRLFDEQQINSGFELLKSDPAYLKASADVANTKAQLVFAHLDLAKLTSIVRPLVEGRNDISNISDSPIDTIVYARSVEDDMHDYFRAVVKAKSPDQERWLRSLHGAGETEGLKQIPNDAFFALSINGTSLVSLKDSALSESMSAEHAKQKENLKIMDGIKELALGVRNAKGASPFPDIFIVLRSGNGDEITKSIQAHILSLSADNAPGLEWRNKQLDKLSISYIFHPLGFGLYLAKIDNFVLLASSEQALIDLVNSAQDAKISIHGTLTTSVHESLANLAPMAFAHIKFDGLANLIEGIQTNLAMFTGGQSALNTNEIAELREMGDMTLGLARTDNILKVDVHYSK